MAAGWAVTWHPSLFPQPRTRVSVGLARLCAKPGLGLKLSLPLQNYSGAVILSTTATQPGLQPTALHSCCCQAPISTTPAAPTTRTLPACSLSCPSSAAHPARPGGEVTLASHSTGSGHNNASPQRPRSPRARLPTAHRAAHTGISISPRTIDHRNLQPPHPSRDPTSASRHFLRGFEPYSTLPQPATACHPI